MPSIARLVSLTSALAALTVANSAAAETPDCGLYQVGSSALVECANPNDSPGPYTPPTVQFFVQQDAQGVTAELDDGTVIDLDVNASGDIEYAIDGQTTTAAAVSFALDAQLTEDEQAAVSAALEDSSETSASDELLDLLAD